jgi:iron(III) transport system permease protein
MTAPAAARSGRRRSGRPASVAVALGAAALVLLPMAALAVGVLAGGAAPWERVAASGWLRQTGTTVALVALVVTGALVLGGGLAWLTAAYRFPGRRAVSWLLVLPLAVPGYILGLVWSSLLSYPGPLQSANRSVFGEDAWFPPVRTLPVAALVLTLTLYPYVYLLARAAFRSQAATPYGAARTLGLGPVGAAARVVLPLARPSLAAGGLLVALETLADFATVQYFGVDTLSVGIYRVWRGQFDRPAATVLAVLVLLLALSLLAIERYLRRGARFSGALRDTTPLQPVQLRGGRAWAATAACVAVLAVAVVVPVVTLATWSATTPLRGPDGRFDTALLAAAVNSALLAAQVAAVVVVVALLLVHAARVDPRRRVRGAVQVTLSGYAVPGPVLAIGALLVFAAAREVLDAAGLPGGAALVAGSVAGLVAVLSVRFLALGFTTVDARLASVSPSLTSAALTLGAPPRQVLRRVHLPLARSGVAVAAVLVAVDALKELPVVLLLRPIGFDTLSVRVWQLAADSRYEMAGFPALMIVLVAMLPVALLFRRELLDPPARVGPRPEAAGPDDTVVDDELRLALTGADAGSSR